MRRYLQADLLFPSCPFSSAATKRRVFQKTGARVWVMIPFSLSIWDSSHRRRMNIYCLSAVALCCPPRPHRLAFLRPSAKWLRCPFKEGKKVPLFSLTIHNLTQEVAHRTQIQWAAWLRLGDNTTGTTVGKCSCAFSGAAPECTEVMHGMHRGRKSGALHQAGGRSRFSATFKKENEACGCRAFDSWLIESGTEKSRAAWCALMKTLAALMI